MENKIYEKFKENEISSANHYFKVIGINEEITGTIPNKNFDILTLLNHLGLLPEDPKNLDKINEFYEYLFKYGIELGISTGKKITIEAIQNNEIDFEELMEIDPESLVKYNMEPKFITDIKEAIMNEK